MQRPELLARPENPNPKWPVPKDLIELQPSYKQVYFFYSILTFLCNVLLGFWFFYRITGILTGMLLQAVKLHTLLID